MEVFFGAENSIPAWGIFRIAWFFRSRIVCGLRDNFSKNPFIPFAGDSFLGD